MATREEGLLQRHFSCFVDPADVEVARALVRNLRRSQRAVESGVVSLRDGEGKAVPTACNVSAIRDWKGKALGFVLACRDLKEIVRSKEIIQEQEERLRDTQERYSALFSRSLVCVYVYDLEGNFLDGNQAVLDLLGYTREEVPSLNLASVIAEEQLPDAIEHARRLIRTGRIDTLASWKLRRKDGSFIWAETESSLVYRRRSPTRFRGSFRDITERKRADEELKRHNEELKELDRMKDSFLSSVSHELRTPLTSIRSFSEILLKYDQEDSKTQKEFLGIINSESERLTRLINDVLDLSRIEAGGMIWNDAPCRSRRSFAASCRHSESSSRGSLSGFPWTWLPTFPLSLPTVTGCCKWSRTSWQTLSSFPTEEGRSAFGRRPLRAGVRKSPPHGSR